MTSLSDYRPMANQEPIHRSAAPELLIHGGKRSGLSVVAATEFVSRVTGQRIITEDGSEIPARFHDDGPPESRKYWVIGWDWENIGRVYKQLFEPWIREQPLLTEDLLAEDPFTWHSDHQPSQCRLASGATIDFFTSAMIPKGGDAINGIWIDGDTQNPSVVYEWQDRLTDREGWFMWSMWPHSLNRAVMDIMERAQSGTHFTDYFCLLSHENSHIK